MVKRVEHEVLVVALENMHVGKRPRDAHDANGVWPAVNHVSQAEHDVIRARGHALEHALERRTMPVDIREDVCRHGGTPRRWSWTLA